MNYNNYPLNYTPQNYTTQQTYQNNGINWVQGLAGAKSFLVGAGNSALLMDSEEQVFYIKSTDQSGMPLPLRVFDYKERTNTSPETPLNNTFNSTEYVTKDELEKRLQQILGKDDTNGKSSIQSNE